MNIKERIKNDEEGNSSAIIVLLFFPIIIAIFGITVDAMLYAYAKNAVQSAADSSAAVLASSLELPNFQQQYQSIYKSNLGNAEMVLAGNGTISYTINTAQRRVCVSVTENVDFVFIDSLPGIATSPVAQIVIANPGGSTASGFKNSSADYACAIIK